MRYIRWRKYASVEKRARDQVEKLARVNAER